MTVRIIPSKNLMKLFNQDHGLSNIHFNCKSLPQNFEKVKET